MQLLDLTLPTLAENLALDEALLLDAEAGNANEWLRLWESPCHGVVLGAGGRLAEDVKEEACQAERVPILRRTSGGGTVLLGPGCLCFSLIMAYEGSVALHAIPSSYGCILETIQASLASLVPDIRFAGISDLAIRGLKFSGNSQQRKQSYLLHHGTLLYAFDIDRIGRYLHVPARQPEYRSNRDHGAFLCNLPLTAQQLKSRLQLAWEADDNDQPWPVERVAALVRDKHSQAWWINRR